MSSVDFLFTPSVQRVLGATLLQPERSFTLQELLTLAESGRGSTQLQIDRLIAAGVLMEGPRRGRQRSIRANPRFFLYEELRSIARKSFGLAEPLRTQLAPWAGQIEQAWVFGSVARGQDVAGSDIDLLVVGHASLLELSEAMHAAEQNLGRPIHLSLYEPAEWQRLLRTDPVVGEIANGPRLTLLPHEPPT